MGDLISIGVLGCADIAKRMVIPSILQSNKFKLVAIASRDIEKAKLFANLFNCEAIVGYENLIERKDIDALYIPLPTGIHFELIMKGLNAGKHILSEKSLCTDFNQTKKVISLANELNLCVFENFMFPFHSQFEFLRQHIQNNTIGEIRLLRATFGFPPFNINTNIRYKKELEGGALLDAGAYTIMAAHLILGQNQKVLASSLDYGNWEIDYQGSALLKSSDGVVSHLAFGFDNYYQNSIELWGSKGKIIVDRAFTPPPGYNPKVTIEIQNVKSEHLLPADNHFLKLIVKFADCISTNNYSYMHEQLLVQSSILSQIKLMANK